jgi:hypothetical protein
VCKNFFLQFFMILHTGIFREKGPLYKKLASPGVQKKKIKESSTKILYRKRYSPNPSQPKPKPILNPNPNPSSTHPQPIPNPSPTHPNPSQPSPQPSPTQPDPSPDQAKRTHFVLIRDFKFTIPSPFVWGIEKIGLEKLIFVYSLKKKHYSLLFLYKKKGLFSIENIYIYIYIYIYLYIYTNYI